MLFEQVDIQKVLSRIVTQVNCDPDWQEDLMQEGIIHLWLLEERKPGQSRSWYLQSCQFHLRHYLDQGRSIDSWKRQEHAISLFVEIDSNEPECCLPDNATTTAMSEINAQDMLFLLCKRLTLSQQVVLAHFMDGLSSREIGLKLGVSHNAVIKHRYRIAAAARELGFSPSTY